ncbi:S-layer homology domain-containing protein, partial [Paenibacillus sp. WST5]|nr:S-layer homology domain-containing protein [Paenibacillus sedimenti]
NVMYKDAKDAIKTASFEVEVKDELPTVDKLTADENYDSTTNKTYAYEYMNLKAVDQYGVEYTTTEINAYDALTQIRYTLEDATTPTGGTAATINSGTGQITLNDSTSFTLKAISASGKVVTTFVTHQ